MTMFLLGLLAPESLRGDDPTAALALIRSRRSLSIERLLVGRAVAGASANPPGSAAARGNPPE